MLWEYNTIMTLLVLRHWRPTNEKTYLGSLLCYNCCKWEMCWNVWKPLLRGHLCLGSLLLLKDRVLLLMAFYLVQANSVLLRAPKATKIRTHDLLLCLFCSPPCSCRRCCTSVSFWMLEFASECRSNLYSWGRIKITEMRVFFFAISNYVAFNSSSSCCRR